MARETFRPRVELIEDRLNPGVAVPGVVTAPADFFGGPSLVVDFDRTPDGQAIPSATPISTQYAGLGVRFSFAGRPDFPVTSSPSFADSVSRPNSLYNGAAQNGGAGAVVVVTFDPAVRTPLPTAVGFVFTDSPQNDPFTVRAYDAGNNVVDAVTINTANGSAVPLAGDTEDTFVGLRSAGGIARIEYSIDRAVAGTIVGVEIDNLRFNTPGVPPPPPPPGTGIGTPGPGSPPPDLAVIAAGAGATVYRPAVNDQLAAQGGAFAPFGLPGVVRGASGDVDGDGSTDLVYVTGPGGGALVRIISGRTGENLISGGTFNAFPGENLTNIGLFVAVGDFNADGKAEVVITPDQGGGPVVKVFQLSGGTLTAARGNFFGIQGDPNFRGGARIAVGNLNNDAFPDLVVAAGFGGGPRVAVFDGRNLFAATPTKLVNDFFAFPEDAQTLRNGVFVAVGDLNGDGAGELIFGGGPLGAPRVLVAQYAAVAQNPLAGVNPANAYANFFVDNNSADRGGVRVAAKRAEGEDRFDLIVGSGDGSVGRVRVYRGTTLSNSPTASQAFDFGGGVLTTGVFVG